jgi:hypothetical protein
VLATTILAVAAVTLILVSRQHHSSSAPPVRGSQSVSSAYGYPARCLAVTVDPSDRAYARADFDRRRECGRWHGYTTAIFHRLDGRWREVLDTSNYSCPVSSLPKVVQEQLAVCPIAQTK